MAWFKVDDGLHSSRKFLSIPRRNRFAAIGLWVVAGSWAVGQKTNGEIPAYVVAELGGTGEQTEALVKADLWVAVEGGWRFCEWRKRQDGDYRPNIRKSVRAAVMARDNHQCVECGSTTNLSLDHIVRYRDDGPDTVENLRVLCMPCNVGRG